MPDLFFTPSSQQAALFAFAEHGAGNAAMEACAGSGKSSTLTRAAPLMSGTTWIGAFNA
jgi:superfamily I DNA/RNA helicase